MSTPHTTLGVIIGNRDFFPDKLVAEARTDLTKLFADLDIDGDAAADGDGALLAIGITQEER